MSIGAGIAVGIMWLSLALMSETVSDFGLFLLAIACFILTRLIVEWKE